MKKTFSLILTMTLALVGSVAFGQRDNTNPTNPDYNEQNRVVVDGNIYGGGALANVAGNSEVLIDKEKVLIKGNVFGGGLGRLYQAATDAQGTEGEEGYVPAQEEVSAVEALVQGDATVTVTANANLGTIKGSVFGCNDQNGKPQGAVTVTVNGGTVETDVYGGGKLAAYDGSPVVTINGGTVERDVYGGGALANVGGNTTVNINGGTIDHDIYGGGLGRKANEESGVTAVAATVGGTATVNIGSGTPGATFTDDVTELGGTASIGGNVYGCNNANGSPQDDVTVNIFQTAHTDGTGDDPDNTVDGDAFAIANVFGGGNAADYAPEDGDENTTKKATVNIYTCDNTIGRVFGGGDAAATPSVETNIQGGRIGMVFGGGNGEAGEPGANVNGNVNLNIHGGTIGEFYGGSNQHGTISGSISTVVDTDGPCGSLDIDEFFCGGNFVDIANGLTTNILCSQNLNFTYFYGGCNQANISGDVVLNLYGGHFTYVFGGSKGRLAHPNAIHPEYTDSTHPLAQSADITGNVTLNLYGGTIENVFGGNNVLGNIEGKITVNVLDVESEQCPLIITNIYGGSNLTSYDPTEESEPEGSMVSPIVNVVHAKYGIAGNVYGGSKGEEGFETNVKANPLVNVGYDEDDMEDYLPSTYVNTYSSLLASPRAIIAGSVFGGGDAATVQGNTKIFLRNRAKVFGNVYGGGNMGEVTGNTQVIVNGDNQ